MAPNRTYYSVNVLNGRDVFGHRVSTTYIIRSSRADALNDMNGFLEDNPNLPPSDVYVKEIVVPTNGSFSIDDEDDKVFFISDETTPPRNRRIPVVLNRWYEHGLNSLGPVITFDDGEQLLVPVS